MEQAEEENAPGEGAPRQSHQRSVTPKRVRVSIPGMSASSDASNQDTDPGSGNWPDWVQDAVFYQIFPDRFARSERVHKPGNLEEWDSPPTPHGYKGGDLLGIVEHLDYLQDLGITALYLCPVFASASNHRYHTQDYHTVDPMLGGGEALAELLGACHARGMRVVLDGVFNHASRGFLQFNDLLENGPSSAYRDWFHVHHFPLNAYGGGQLGYDAWWGIAALPKFNTTNPDVREYLFRVGEKWLGEGIDGWRLDVPNEIDDDEFWREFRRRCRAVNPEAYLVGEIWDDAQRWLQGDIFDGVMNYQLTRAIYGFVARDWAHDELSRSGLNGISPISAGQFAETTTRLLAHYPEAAVHSQLNLLGSHDTPRLMTALKGDAAAVRLALLLQFGWPGAPCVYYGDELGLRGGHDPGCRQGMPWDETGANAPQLHDFVRALVSARHELAALRRGSIQVSAPADGLIVVERQLEGAPAAWVIVNVQDESVDVPADALPEGAYRDVLTGATLQQRAGAELAPGRGGLLLVGA